MRRRPAHRPLDNVCIIMHTARSRPYSVIKTAEFATWLENQVPKTRTIVLARLDMVTIGHLGDYKRFEGLVELRWKNGARVYCFFWRATVVVILHGGNKNAQDRDIKKAKRIRDEVLNGSRSL